jgi:hypothetical protein
MLMVDEVKIDPVNVNDIGLGRVSTQKSNPKGLLHSRTARGHARPTWQRLLSWPTCAGMRKENGVWH